MEIKLEIKFESAIDVAKILDDKNNLRKYLAEFFDCSEKLFEQTKGNFTSIVRNDETNYYNVDFDLLVYSFLKFLESLELDRNALSNARYLFDKINPTAARKSAVFLINVLAYYNITPQPKNGFFYMPIISRKIGSTVYFQYNSVGLNRTALLELFGQEFEEKYIIPIAGNNKISEVVGIGLKAINTHKKVGDYQMKIS